VAAVALAAAVAAHLPAGSQICRRLHTRIRSSKRIQMGPPQAWPEPEPGRLQAPGQLEEGDEK